jgi:hypothetical protein
VIAIYAKQTSGDSTAAAEPTLDLADCAAHAGKRDDAIAGYREGIDMLAHATGADDIKRRDEAKTTLAKLTSR